MDGPQAAHIGPAANTVSLRRSRRESFRLFVITLHWIASD
jgi:hypothetical protein